MRAHAVVLGGAALVLGALPADARTIAVVPRVVLRARPPSKLVPGSPGTLEHAIATHAKKVRSKRPQSDGDLPERDPDGACPPEMGNVDGRFCADRWEATLEEVTDDGAARPWAPNLALDPARRYRAVSVAGVQPQGYISGAQAQEACRASGKRLCASVEWRLACSGSQGSVYPYGTSRIEGRCNDHGRSPMAVFYPAIEKSWKGITNMDMNDPRLNLLEGTVAKTGEHAGCVSDWGLHDLVGNLHEWTADPNGTFQGGYYLDTAINGEGCAYRTTAHHFEYHDYSTGFRCCADLRAAPEPD